MSKSDRPRWNRPPLTESADRFAASFPLTSPPDEQPGADGIRWGLVNRVRAEIAAGTYDDDEKWAKAEALLLQQVGRE